MTNKTEKNNRTNFSWKNTSALGKYFILKNIISHSTNFCLICLYHVTWKKLLEIRYC